MLQAANVLYDLPGLQGLERGLLPRRLPGVLVGKSLFALTIRNISPGPVVGSKHLDLASIPRLPKRNLPLSVDILRAFLF